MRQAAATGREQAPRCRRFHPDKDDGHCVLTDGRELPHRCEPAVTHPAVWCGDERDDPPAAEQEEAGEPEVDGRRRASAMPPAEQERLRSNAAGTGKALEQVGLLERLREHEPEPMTDDEWRILLQLIIKHTGTHHFQQWDTFSLPLPGTPDRLYVQWAIQPPDGFEYEHLYPLLDPETGRVKDPPATAGEQS